MIKSMTSIEFEKKVSLLIENIKRDTTLFVDDTPQKQRERVELSHDDFFYFAQTYFPHYIRADFGQPHRDMHRATSVRGQITGIAGFRGLGKTTLLSIIKPIWLSLLPDGHPERIYFNVKVAKNKEKAIERTVAIRCEFLYNRRLVSDFGEQLPLTAGAESDFVIKSGTRFLGIGYKEGIRGAIHNSRRPDYIDIDDLEDHQAHNPKIASDKLQFVTEEAFGAFEKGDGILVWLGNLTHQHSALNLFYKSCSDETGSFRKFLLIPADDGHFHPTWSEHFSVSELLSIYDAMGKFGYERHMRCNPVIEGLKFKEEWFRYYEPQDISSTLGNIVSYCDPSLGDRSTSDYKSIITLAFLEKRYFVLDVYLRKATIIDMLKYMYHLHQQYKSHLFMESNFWQKVIWDYIPALSAEYGYLLPVQGVVNTEKKELRIERIQPLFEWGWILFPPPCPPHKCGGSNGTDLQLLIDQLLGFPAFSYDDGPDALAGAISAIKSYNEPMTYQSIKRTVATPYSNLW